MYTDGRGIRKDYRLALEWYSKAAEQRYGAAMLGICMLYKDGKGVDTNGVLAYAYSLLAAKAEVNGAMDVAKELAAQLSSRQVTEGQLLAAAWKAGKPLPTESKTWPAHFDQSNRQGAEQSTRRGSSTSETPRQPVAVSREVCVPDSNPHHAALGHQACHTEIFYQ
jgi:hypothetical protein